MSPGGRSRAAVHVLSSEGINRDSSCGLDAHRGGVDDRGEQGDKHGEFRSQRDAGTERVEQSHAIRRSSSYNRTCLCLASSPPCIPTARSSPSLDLRDAYLLSNSDKHMTGSANRRTT